MPMELTRKTELRHSKPLWSETPNRVVATQQKMSRTDFDVIVVGGGISAAIVTRLLSRSGRKILVVDRRRPVQGSTMASTAMIQHEIDVPLSELAGAIGKKGAFAAWQRSARAVGDLGRLVEEHGVECRFEEKKTLFLAGDTLGYRALQTEAAMREEAGLVATYLGGHELGDQFGIGRTGAILSNVSASANPAQLTAGLFNSLPAGDVTIVEAVEITDYRETAKEVVLATSVGRLLGAGHVVFCTGYEFLKSMQSKRHQILATWAMATRPNSPRPAWLDSHLVWEASDPYLYFRSTPDGRIIAGGGDEMADDTIEDPARMRRKMRDIRAKLESLLGQKIPEPDYSWAARFGATDDGLPIIDRVPGCDRIFSVMGFGGNGITFSMIAAQIVEKWVAGQEDADARLFAFR
jgi:glycine/D-amino acid oxidase-like deaminating enzyme